MGRYKCAYNCENSSDPDTKFFKFPLYNPRKLKKWLLNMKWEGWTPTRFSALCINHFEEQYIDRTGKCLTLREDAVPTIFTSSDKTQKKKVFHKTKRKRQKIQTPEETLQSSYPSTAVSDVQNSEFDLREKEPIEDKEQKTTERWRIIMDERLMKIDSFPHFFHGNYCVPQGIQWAPDSELKTDCNESENVIEVKEPWEWLALDVRGPLPQTLNGHKYVVTVTDFYSKWVEAIPMSMCLPSNVAKSIADIIAHFGYPVRILSRLPHDVVHKINRELKDLLQVPVALVVYHKQTGTADLVTPQLIDRMVSELTEEHPADWDVYLPAKVFSLCLKEHSKTTEMPFSLLFSKGLEPIQSPRGLNNDYSQIQESSFMIS